MSKTAAARSPSLCVASRVRKASRRITQIYDRRLEPFGLTVTQFGIMAQLRATPGVGISALAETMIMDSTTLSRNLQPLERRGLVVAEADEQDRRARRLKLTQDGREALERAMAGWSAAQREVADALGAADVAALNATLDAALEKLSH